MRLASLAALSLGALIRQKDIRTADDFATPEIVATDTTIYGGRAQIGWSWLLGEHVFIAAAVGLSVGYETGKETTDRSSSDMMPPVEHDVSRAAVSGEGYLRFGIAN